MTMIRALRRAAGGVAASIALFGYIGSIVMANWLIETFGIVSLFGLAMPAGVFAAGFAFTFRDLVQDRLGRWWALVAIGAGALVSLAISDPFVAAASATAFAISEVCDMVVYSPLKRRGWLRAVAASNVVGSAVDSVAFLLLAFGSLDFLVGQLVGKWGVTAATVAVLWAWRACGRVLARHASAELAGAD